MSGNRKLPEKTIDNVGKEDTCPICNTKVHLGVKKVEGYADKLQWWNEDNKAHYNWDGHKNTCNIPGGRDEPPQQPAPSTEQIKQEVKTVNGPMMANADWWERSWTQALRIASHTCKAPSDSTDARICACGIMHDFATLELARVFKQVLDAEKKK